MDNLYWVIKILINLFPPRPAKTGPFVILLCLMPDDFTHQERAGWERVNVMPPPLVTSTPLRQNPAVFVSTVHTPVNALLSRFQDIL